MKAFLPLRPLFCGVLLAGTQPAFASNPVLTFRGTVTTGDNTAFVDQVVILSGTSGSATVAGAVANGSFETSDPLANSTYGYVPTGGGWTFGSGSGIAATGAGFAPTNIPQGSRVGFLQGASQFQQTLVLPTTGSYRVRFSAAQRNSTPANVQQIQVLIDGVVVNTTTIQPGSTAYTQYTVGFSITGSTPFNFASLAPTRNQLGVDRTGDVALTFNAPADAALVAKTSIFSSQYGGLLSLRRAPVLSGNTATLTPSRYFKAGEMVSVTVPNTVVSSALGQATNNAQVYQFAVATQNNGTGNGTFSGTTNQTTGTSPGSLAVGDVDGDGRLDLVVANRGTDNVSIFRNLGNTGTGGALAFAAKVDFALPTNATPYAVALGDLDGDGDLDMVTANYGTDNISILQNTVAAPGALSNSGSTNSFATRVQFATGTSPGSLALGDLDADGDLDIVTSNFDDNNLTVLRNVILSPQTLLSNGLAASTTFTTAGFNAETAPATGTAPGDVTLGDFDNDGLLDIVVNNSGPNTVSVLLNTTVSPAATSFATRVNFTVGSTPYGVALGDFNGDGKLDIVTANYGASTVSVLQNTTAGPGSTPTATTTTLTIGTSPISVAIADVNADGRPDILATNYNNSAGTTVSALLRNAANNGFATQTTTTVGTGPRGIAAGDLDGDGDVDFATAGIGPNTISYRINGTTAATLPLPVELVSFTAECRGAAVALSWRTASERNSRGFEVQRSTDGKTFKALTFVESLSTSAKGGSYATTDRNVAGAAYYRLLQVDTDGTESYSPVATTSCATAEPATARLTLLPNPAQGRVQVLGTTGPVQVLDLTGRLLRQQPTGETLSLEGLAPGIYLVRSGAHSARLHVQ